MDKPRRAYCRIEYDGRDVTDEFSKMLLSITYTDNIDSADEVILTLEDIDQNLSGPWYPKVAAKG